MIGTTQAERNRPTIPVTLRLAVFGMIAAIFGLTADPAAAQEARYWLDDHLERCIDRQEPRTYTALAYTDFTYSYCVWGRTSKNQARRAALRECNRYIPRKYRKIVPCRIVYEDGFISDPDVFERRRKEVRIPITIDIYDGEHKKRQVLDGYIVSGKFKDRTKRPVAFVTVDGKTICDGDFNVRATGAKFNMTCFEVYRFKNAGFKHASGYIQLDGFYYPYLDATLKHRKSTIGVKIREVPAQ